MEFEIAEGSDGWLFLTRGQHKVIDLYRAESAFTPEMAEAWVRLLSQRTDRLKAMGIDLEEVATKLEDEGVGSFAKAFDEVLETLGNRAEEVS